MTEFPANQTVLAVDIGGTKIAAAGVTGSGQIVARRREATPVTGPTDLIARLTAMLADLRLEAGSPVAVGIGIPAMLEPNSDRVLWAPNIPGCRDVLLREPLEQALGVPVFLEYDGHTAVLGEWWQGAGRGYQNVVFSIIGTGIGGGMIVNGTLYRGRNRLAGAAGWFTLSTTLDDIDEARTCGQWELLAAGPGVVRRAQLGIAAGRETELTGDLLTAEAVFAAARRGDAFAKEIVAETVRLIGIGVSNIVSLMNPDIVILGGGVGAQADLILEPVRCIVRTWAQPVSGNSVQIECSRLGDDAGLLGAAYGAFERVRDSKGGEPT